MHQLRILSLVQVIHTYYPFVMVENTNNISQNGAYWWKCGQIYHKNVVCEPNFHIASLHGYDYNLSKVEHNSYLLPFSSQQSVGER